jgi:signal transduction histidine kinase/CheY-like chemotaxis protein
VRYQYRVDGVDEQWIDAGDARLVTYNNIGQGTYTFRVRAIGPGGIPGANEGRASFTVPAYPYETPAFFGFLLVSAGLLGWIVFELRVRELRRREVELTRQVEVRTRKLEAALQTVAEQSEALRTLDEAKSRFFANVSHEFRTPLSLILGPANDLRDGRAGALPAAARRLVDNLTGSANRLLQLVEQLLDVARLESATLQLRAEVHDLIPLVRRMADSFASLAEQRGIAFRLSHPVGAVRVRYDTDKMEKIIGNLVGNALKFTPPGGSVVLSCNADTTQGGVAVLEVQDSGPGIAPAHQPRVFDRFYQVDDSSRRAHEGLGIGLALAKELVELHGGQITLHSVEGSGCTFTVRLPLAPATSRSVEPLVAAGAGMDVVRSARTRSVGSSKRALRPPRAPEDVVTVLVVEDNVELLEFLGDHLAERYRVLTASNGVHALEITREHVPDLIISDVMMPAMDGLSLCAAVKQDPEIDFVPVILLTAKASRDSRLAGLSGGADDYLTKPVDLVELMVRAENLIRSRHRVRERYRAEQRALPVVEVPLKATLPDATSRALVEKFFAIVADRLGDDGFDVEAMAVAMGLSRTTLYRKVGAALGKSPVDALWDYRMAQAAQWLEETPITVSEVAYGVGFKSVPHFCAKFRALYGETPSGYRRARTAVT